MRVCVTHHHTYDCRKAEFERMKASLKIATTALEKIQRKGNSLDLSLCDIELLSDCTVIAQGTLVHCQGLSPDVQSGWSSKMQKASSGDGETK